MYVHTVLNVNVLWTVWKRGRNPYKVLSIAAHNGEGGTGCESVSGGLCLNKPPACDWVHSEVEEGSQGWRHLLCDWPLMALFTSNSRGMRLPGCYFVYSPELADQAKCDWSCSLPRQGFSQTSQWRRGEVCSKEPKFGLLSKVLWDPLNALLPSPQMKRHKPVMHPLQCTLIYKLVRQKLSQAMLPHRKKCDLFKVWW